MAVLVFEDMHDLADPLDRDLGVFGLAVPDPPVQTLNLSNDHRLRLHPTRLVGRQHFGRLLRVLKPHSDVEPVKDRQARDTGIGQNGPQTRATIGERWGAARFDETAGCGRGHRNRRSEPWIRPAATSPRGRRRAPTTLTPAPPRAVPGRSVVTPPGASSPPSPACCAVSRWRPWPASSTSPSPA